MTELKHTHEGGKKCLACRVETLGEFVERYYRDICVDEARDGLACITAALASLPMMLAKALGSVLELFGERESAQAPVRLSSQTQRDAADRVLAASDCEDLIDALDAEHKLLTSDAGADSVVAKQFDPAILVAKLESNPLDMRSLRLTLGETGAERCVLGFNALANFLREAIPMMKMAEAAGQMVDQATDATFATEPFILSDFFSDPRVPLPIRRGLLTVLRSFSAMTTIARAEEFGSRLPPWLGLALAEHFAEGLLLLSKLPQKLREPEALLSAFAAEESEREMLRTRLNKWHWEAERSGDSVYYPLGNHLD